MTILYIIIPIAIILVSSFVFFFIWAVKTEQFDDLETPAHKILIDDWNDKLTNFQSPSFPLFQKGAKGD
ncbi:MAG: cbb3-type cytochrome oxidase assembly protein CcoS [Planctomycetota bacterium]